MAGVLVSGMIVFCCKSAFSQTGEIPSHLQPYAIDSGIHNGEGTQTKMAFSHKIQFGSDVIWMRIKFSSYFLGSESYIEIRAAKDGETQRLNYKSMSDWYASSAFFNGNELDIQLFVAPSDTGIYFATQEIIVGEPIPEELVVSICGSSDDRYPTTDEAIGRIYFQVGGNTSYCTGWIMSTGPLLTAGHCYVPYPYGNHIIEFNVPPSTGNGDPIHSSVDDQYPINTSSAQASYNGIGNDWCIFMCNPNSNTGLVPWQAQNQRYYLESTDYDLMGPNTTISGYGADMDPPWDNLTLQTHTGLYRWEQTPDPDHSYLEYYTDTMGGNSGSPIIEPLDNVGMGIHTNGGCDPTDPPENGNKGTSFKSQPVKTALNHYLGYPNTSLDVKHVDPNHPSVFDLGEVFAPYYYIQTGVDWVANGGVVLLASGTYNQNVVATRPMTIKSIIGPIVIIGH